MLEIHFIGGPFDGHQQADQRCLEHLPLDVAWLVCDDAFRQLDGKILQKHGCLTSVALYRLDRSTATACYRYEGAISARDFGDALDKLSS